MILLNEWPLMLKKCVYIVVQHGTQHGRQQEKTACT